MSPPPARRIAISLFLRRSSGSGGYLRFFCVTTPSPPPPSPPPFLLCSYAAEALADRPEEFEWVVLFGAVAPGLALASQAAKKDNQVLIYAASYGIIGGFLFMGVMSGWIGGGDISLLALSTGSISACSKYAPRFYLCVVENQH